MTLSTFYYIFVSNALQARQLLPAAALNYHTMPVKWKIYYLCNLYNILFQAVFAALLIYSFIFEYNSNSDRWLMALVLSGFLLAGLRSFLSLRFIYFFKKGRMYAKNMRVTFIIGYCITDILFLCAVAVSAVFIRALVIYRHNYMTAKDFAIGISIIIFSITLLWSIIFDFQLLKVIRKQYNMDIDKIGEDILQLN